MKKIYKYSFKYIFEITHSITIEMPKNALILDLQIQNGIPCLWAVVDLDESMVPYNFVLLGTGHPVPDEEYELQHISTFQQGEFVWHLFQIIDE